MGVWIETTDGSNDEDDDDVTPFVGVWIETRKPVHLLVRLIVTPFVGVWIETSLANTYLGSVESHPSWVCGLKLEDKPNIKYLLSHTLRGCVD